MEKLGNWLNEKGAKTEFVKVEQTIDKGAGLFLALGQIDTFSSAVSSFPSSSSSSSSTTRIYSPVNLATIPNSCLIDANMLLLIKNTNLQSVVDQFLTCCMISDFPFTERISIILSLCLISKYSTFIPQLEEFRVYVDILPPFSSFNNPILWNEEELSLLHGTPLLEAINAKQSQLEREIPFLIQSFFEPLETLIGLGHPVFNPYDFIWFDMIFWSRVLSFKRDTDPLATFNPNLRSFSHLDNRLIPLLDLANHSNTPNIRWEPANEGVSILTYDTIEISDGMELFLSYGVKSNTEFIFGHGFYLDNNEHNESYCFPVFIDVNDPLKSLKISEIRGRRLSPMICIEAKKLQQFKVSGKLKDLVSPSNLTVLSISVMESEVLTNVEIDNDGNVEKIKDRIKKACLERVELMHEKHQSRKIGGKRADMAVRYKKDLLNLLRETIASMST